MQARVRSGKWPGRAPIGYRNVNKDIVQDPDMAHAVRVIFISYSQGLSCEEILDRLYDEGVDIIDQHKCKKFTETIIRKVLQNPFYYGIMRYKGKEYPHIYPPIIPEVIFRAVQAIYVD